MIGQQPPRKGNAGVAAAVIGGLATVGGIAAAAFLARPKAAPPQRFGAPRPDAPRKKPCNCGR